MQRYNISESYIKELKELHAKKTFGNSKNIPQEVKNLIKEKNIKSILDFGCGKGKFSNSLKEHYPDITVFSYDPVTNPIKIPSKVDLVYSSDVLEHVELNEIDNTLQHLLSIATYQYHLIACHPAKKTLSDGRNAHLIIESPQWWETKIKSHLANNWSILNSKNYVHYGKTKKSGILEQEKYIVTLEKSVSK